MGLKVFDPSTLRFVTILALAITIVGLAGVPFGKMRRLRSEGRSFTTSWKDPTRAMSKIRDGLLIVSVGIVFTAFLFPQFVLGGAFELGFPFDSIVQVLGLLVLSCGALLVGWSVRTLGRFSTERIGLQKDHQLVQSGPYRFARHPIYGGMLLLGLGYFLLELNVVLLVLAALIFLVNVYRARVEEKLLSSAEAFGNVYLDYRRRTRRFVPFVF